MGGRGDLVFFFLRFFRRVLNIMLITESFVKQCQTERGGWTKDQLEVLGVKWPPKNGWIDSVCGMEISSETAQAFIDLRNKRARQKKPVCVEKKQKTKKSKQEKKQKRLEAYERFVAKTVAPRIEKPRSAPIKKAPYVATDAFLSSYEWRRVRMEALKLHGARCQCCGASPADGAVMNVDHIKPRKLFPHLALDVNNLQILCGECNHGKGNWDMTDWRPHIKAIVAGG